MAKRRPTKTRKSAAPRKARKTAKTAKPRKAKTREKAKPKAAPPQKFRAAPPLKSKAAPPLKSKAAPPRRAPNKVPAKRISSRRRKSLVRRVADAMRAVPQMKLRVGASPYDRDLDKNPANYQSLTPLSFLERAASVYPDSVAIVHGGARTTYADFYARSKKLASALRKRGIRKNDTVAVMLANTPPMLEAHYGVPMAGAVLNALNTRLDAATLAFMLDHGEAKVLITDREFSATAKEALRLAKVKPFVIDYDDREFPQSGEFLGAIEYEAFLGEGDGDFSWAPPADEWDAIALNYTSGTTGNPKGVVFHLSLIHI